MIATALSLEAGTQLAKHVLDDPLLFAIRVLRVVGVSFLVAGAVGGVFGFYSKSSSVTALNQDAAELQTLQGYFNNMPAITFRPAAMGTAPILGSNPVSDLTNFVNDAKTDLFGLGQDISQGIGALETGIQDVGIAVEDVARAFVAFIGQFPRFLWNGLVWVFGGAVADVLNFVYPYLLIFGGILTATSIALSAIRSGWIHTLEPAYIEARDTWSARQRQKVWDPLFGRLFNNRPAPVALPAPPPEPLKPEVTLQTALPALPVPPEDSPPQPPPTGPVAAAAGEPSSQPQEVGGAGIPPDIAPPADRQPPAATKEEIEQLLGDAAQSNYDRAKALLRSALASKSSPPTEKPVEAEPELEEEVDQEERDLAEIQRILRQPLEA